MVGHAGHLTGHFGRTLGEHNYSVTDDEKRVRSLGCGHSMCTSCLQRMHQRNTVTCPQCRYVHNADSVDRIPICFALEAIIADDRGARGDAECFDNMKSKYASDIDCGMKNLQDAEKKLLDRIDWLEEAKSTH